MLADTLVHKIKERLRSFKKEDYIVMLLVGVLLVIISLPSEKGTGRKTTSDIGGAAGGEQEEEEGTRAENIRASGTGENSTEEASYGADVYTDDYVNAYVEALEKKTEELLSGMEGAGKVQVMITVADCGQEILEKDREMGTSDLEETDQAGGTRKSLEQQQREEVIYTVNGEGDKIPYVIQRKLPEITGVVVMAQGAENNRTKDNIIEAVGVLFNLSEHKIKVIKMKS